MSANQPTAAWAGTGDPLVVVAGHLVSPQDGFGEIGRMPNGNLRRPARITVGADGFSLVNLSGVVGTVVGTAPSSNDVILGDLGGNYTNVQIRTNGVSRWRWLNDGHYETFTDNVLDIGASGANRPRDLFLARNLTMAGTALIGTATPATGGPKLDVASGASSIPTLSLTTGIVDDDDKHGVVTTRHKTNAEENVTMLSASVTAGATRIRIGGGTFASSLLNAATIVEFYTAADTTTLTGTLAADLTGVGAASLLHARGNIRAGASFLAADGLIGTPSFAFVNDPDTGIFSFAANEGAMVANGAGSVRWDNGVGANEMRIILWDVTAAAWKRVRRGAVDSGGAGLRLLLIDN